MEINVHVQNSKRGNIVFPLTIYERNAEVIKRWCKGEDFLVKTRDEPGTLRLLAYPRQFNLEDTYVQKLILGGVYVYKGDTVNKLEPPIEDVWIYTNNKTLVNPFTGNVSVNADALNLRLVANNIYTYMALMP